MNLHEDDEAFAESSYVDEVVFKGGTSLSKAYRLIDRFSEDIYLVVLADNKGDAACKKLLKSVEASASEGLICVKGDARESKGSKFRKTIYQYPRSVEGEGFGQASPELLIEVNTFTSPESFEMRELQTFIAEVLASKGENDLIEKFALDRFSVNVLSVRRTFVEKMLGVIKDSYHEDPVGRMSDRIRHLYDICLILKNDEYRDFVASEEFMPLCNICIEDEKVGFFAPSNCFDTPLIDAPLFSRFKDWSSSLNAIYTSVFSDLVYGDLPAMGEIEEVFDFIKKNLK